MTAKAGRRLWVAALALAVGILLLWTSAAYAYQIVYYFGSPSNPVRISNGTAGSQTSGTAFRLFNEAYAKQSGCGVPCGDMEPVTLFYNTTPIWSCQTGFYCVKYQNGVNVHAGCQISSPGGLGGYPTYAWCDTTY